MAKMLKISGKEEYLSIFCVSYFAFLESIVTDGIHSFGTPSNWRYTRKWIHLCIAISFPRNKLDIFVGGQNMDGICTRKILRLVFNRKS